MNINFRESPVMIHEDTIDWIGKMCFEWIFFCELSNHEIVSFVHVRLPKYVFEKLQENK